MVFCSMSHEPTVEEVATYEAAIGLGDKVAAIAASANAAVGEPVAQPNVEGGQPPADVGEAAAGGQPPADVEEDVNILS